MGCGSSAKTAAAPVAELQKSASSTLGKDTQEDIRDKYDFGNILGSGSFGQVREATLKGVDGSEIRAVKMIERDTEDGEWSNQAIFVREVALLQQVKHENIICFYDFYEDKHFLYVVMELCRGGEVFAKIVEMKRFSERNASHLGRQMLQSIEYIHNLQIAHRDIKAENFMLSEPNIQSQVKMIDFGMATKVAPGHTLTELCGSPHYLAPELIGQSYDHRADVWSLGILLYLLMYGHYPFDAKHPRDIMVKILTEPIRWQTKAKLGKDGLDFLKQLLESDPKKRSSATDALQHSWVKKGSEQEDSELLSQDSLRSAHKKVTATRKQVDVKVEQQRQQKLEAISEDYTKGIRHGKRLGPTPNEEFLNKPEFLRRDNKIVTAPSNQMNSRRNSFMNMLAGMKKDTGGKGGPGGLASVGEAEENTEGESADSDADDKNDAKAGGGKIQPLGMGPLPPLGPGQARDGRAHSVSLPRRYSYIGQLTGTEEARLANLYKDKEKSFESTLGIIPEPQPPPKAPAVSN